MLKWLPPLFFFGVLMGSPAIGLLAFGLLGAVHGWYGWRHPDATDAFQWTRCDTWLVLSFVSIPLFKALSAVWSSAPLLALENALWHSHFLFLPLVLLGLHRCASEYRWIERGLALGLIAYGIYATVVHFSGETILDPRRQNVGVLAQLAMALGGWNLLMLTRPTPTPIFWRVVHTLALIGTVVALLSSTRRLELLGFVVLATCITLWRLRSHLTWTRLIMLAMLIVMAAGLLVYARREKFMLGLQELQTYATHYTLDVSVKLTSWGARLEMWRTGWSAFTDHPWLGLGAEARPSTMQPWGAPPAELFGHRHFHSHLIQTLVEGGLLGLLVALSGLWVSIKKLIIHTWQQQHEWSLLGLSLLLAYAIEGSFSAALFYDKPNSFLVIAIAWLWLQIRPKSELRL